MIPAIKTRPLAPRRTVDMAGRTAIAMALCAALLPLAADRAMAQQPVSGNAAAAATQEFRIAAGSLPSVLSQFSAQSRLQLIYAPELVADKRSGGLNASMAPEAALAEILKEAGLRMRKVDDRTYAIVADDAKPGEGRLGGGLGVSNGRSEASPAVTDIGRLEVTGSRLKRVEVEGVSPVAIFSSQEIEQSGESSVSDFLRATIYNTYGSSGGYLSSNNATVSLRGLGNYYTTVLIDGRRATSAPTLEGAAQNISFIPSAAVERIEIMRGGASAVYGSDAIGGVVNIIMKKDFTGGTFAYATDFPSNSKTGNNAVASFGVGSDRGSITVSVDHLESGDVSYSEFRKFFPEGMPRMTLDSFSPSANFFSPQTGLVSHPNAAQYTAGNPRIHLVDGVYKYDLTMGIGDSRRKKDTVMMHGKLALSERTELFMSAFNSESNNHTVVSDAMILVRPGPYLNIRHDNPYNPFGVDGTLYHIYNPWGPRMTDVLDRSRSVGMGLRGSNDWFSGADWEVGAGYGRVNHHYQGKNYVLGSKLQDLLDAGLYNPFDPSHPSVAAVGSQIDYAPFRQSEHSELSVDGHINFYDIFRLPGGGVQLVVGFDHRESRFSLLHDPQTMAGNVSGLTGSANTVADRTYTAGYFEGLLPVLNRLNLTVAGRYDSYSDFDGRFSPNIGLEFRPNNAWLVRATWERGFRAPTLVDLHSARASGLMSIPAHLGLTPPHPGGDEVAAAALAAYKAANPAGLSPADLAAYQPYPSDPANPLGSYQFITGANPNLDAETSRNLGLGIVFSPSEDLSFALDYYDVEIDGIITVMPPALAARLGEANGSLIRGPDIIAPGGVALPGVIVSVDQTKSNGNSKHVRGVELDANWRIRTGFGDLSTHLAWSHQMQNDLTPVGLPAIDSHGAFTFPKDRGQLTLRWERGPFNVSGLARYIASSGERSQPTHHLPSYMTYDVQLQYNAPWNARLSLGVRNVADKFPPMAVGSGVLPAALYDVDGRTPFVRYTQNF